MQRKMSDWLCKGEWSHENKHRFLVECSGYWAGLTILLLLLSGYAIMSLYFPITLPTCSPEQGRVPKGVIQERSPHQNGPQDLLAHKEKNMSEHLWCAGVISPELDTAPATCDFPGVATVYPISLLSPPPKNRTIKGRLNDKLTWWSVQVHSRDTGHYKGFSNSAREQHNKNQ